MPEMAGVAQTDRLAVLDDILYDQHLRISRQLKLVQHMDLQRTKAAAKGDLLLGGDALVAKHQYVVIEMRAMNAREILIAKRLIQVEPQHFGTHGAVEGTNFDALRRSRAGTGGWSGLGGDSGVGSDRHTKLFVQSERKRQ
jgi:hypothetical protein